MITMSLLLTALVTAQPAHVTLTAPSTVAAAHSKPGWWGEFEISWSSEGTIGDRPCRFSGGNATAWSVELQAGPNGKRTLFAPILSRSASNVSVTFTITCETKDGGFVTQSKDIIFTN